MKIFFLIPALVPSFPGAQQTDPLTTQPCWIAALHEPLTLSDLNSFREEEEEEVERPYLETPGQGRGVGGGAD